jgi:hypothetical protein
LDENPGMVVLLENDLIGKILESGSAIARHNGTIATTL